ncbi:MAG: LVIVD repeat-containing protein [Promethearchaeota archaeon]
MSSRTPKLLLWMILIIPISVISGDTPSLDLELTKVGEIQTGGVAVDIQVIDDLLYVADHLGLLIYNISAPDYPQKVGQYLDGGTGHGIHIDGSYAFIADLVDGLEVYDICTPTSPQKIGSYFDKRMVVDVFVQGSLCYASVHGTEFAVLDVSNPGNITRIGHYDDIVVGYSIYCINNIAFVADYDAGLLILDISNASNPHLIGKFNDGDIIRAIDVEDNIVFASCATDGGFKTINVTEPSNPVLLGEYQNISFGIGVDKKEEYAFVCDYDNGLRILDVDNPVNPTLSGSYEGEKFFHVHVVNEYVYVLQSGGIILILQINKNTSSTSDSSTPGYELVYFLLIFGLISLLHKNKHRKNK